jgi:hypothetical protein
MDDIERVLHMSPNTVMKELKKASISTCRGLHTQRTASDMCYTSAP